MSRAYKNKKFNTDNYTNYAVSSKYFGLQASRFPGSIKKQYCDETGDGFANATFTKRRSEAVGKGTTCVYRSMLPPDFGPSGLEVAPLLGPTNLTTAFGVSNAGPLGLASTIVKPALGPQSLKEKPYPDLGPQDLITSIVEPASGPGSLSSNVIVPSQGPSELISTAAIPISGPQNLDGTVEPMLTPELIGSVVLEVQGLFQGILLDGYYRQVEGLKGYFNPDGDWLTDTVFDGFVYERVIDEDCVPTVYTLWLYKARYPNTRGELLEAWEFGNVQPAQGSRSTRKQVNTGPASTTGVHAQYSNNHESPFRVAGDLSYIFSRFYRRDGAPCE
jgi:hypothetical protein